jgi:hypothetical protein
LLLRKVWYLRCLQSDSSLFRNEQSQKQAEKNWQDCKYQLVINHVGISSTGSKPSVTLAGKRGASGLTFTTDFRCAFQQVF